MLNFLKLDIMQFDCYLNFAGGARFYILRLEAAKLRGLRVPIVRRHSRLVNCYIDDNIVPRGCGMGILQGICKLIPFFLFNF